MTSEKATYEPQQSAAPPYTHDHVSPVASPSMEPSTYQQTGDKATTNPDYSNYQQQSQPYQQPQHQQQQFAPQQNQQQSQYQTTVPIGLLQAQPAPVDCPSCRQRVMTVATPVAGNTTHAWGVALFLTTCCCCIPYMIDGTKDVMHKCSNCGAAIATWHRSGRTETNYHMPQGQGQPQK